MKHITVTLHDTDDVFKVQGSGHIAFAEKPVFRQRHTGHVVVR